VWQARLGVVWHVSTWMGLVRQVWRGAVGSVVARRDAVWRGLAVWRLTELVTEDQVSRTFREAVAKQWPNSQAAYLVTCKRCVSVWAAVAVVLLPARVCRVLALSSATILFNDWRNDQASAALSRRMAASGGVQRAGETD